MLAMTVRPTEAISEPIPPDFVGLSMEWSTAARISAEPAFARLVNHLRTPGAVGPNIRIGGDSADQVWWDPDGTRDKAKSCAASYSHRVCVTHGITAEQMIAHAGLAEAIGGSLTLDLVMLNGASPLPLSCSFRASLQFCKRAKNKRRA